MASKYQNPYLPMKVEGLQHDGRVWHFNTELVLRPVPYLSVECREWQTTGSGHDMEEAKKDFAQAFAVLYDAIMDPSKEETPQLKAQRDRLKLLIKRVVDMREVPATT